MNIRTNLLREIKKQYQKELAAFYGEQEAGSLMNVLVNHFFGLSRVDMSLKPDFRLTETEILKLHFAVKDLKKEKPVQYIIGETEFSGLKLKVTPDVLIPRPETEEMVELIVKDTLGKEKLKILDVGTGSGCIALALKKKLPFSVITAVDVSNAVLEVAKENSRLNKLDVELKNIDILDISSWQKLDRFDLIVSNPPYVTEEDKVLMKKNVTDFEPHLALFVTNEDPLLFYSIIAEFAINHLIEGGSLWFEINENLGDEVLSLLQEKGFVNMALHADLFGKARFVSSVR